MKYFLYPMESGEALSDYYARIRTIATFNGSPGFNVASSIVQIDGDLTGETALTGQALIDAESVFAPAVPEVTAQDQKMEGVLFEGVMCSATSEDMWGLSAIKEFIRAGNSTNFEFKNGNSIVLSPTNVDAFEAVWIPFRQSFYAA